jgi:hypothetical protein
VLLLTTTLVACGGDGNARVGHDTGSSLCPATVSWHGRKYEGAGDRWRAVALGPPVNGVREAACERRPVRAWAINGVPTRIGLVLAPLPPTRVVVAGGQLVVSPTHPLHMAAYGSAKQPVAPGRSACRERDRVSGPVEVVDFFGTIRLHARGHSVRVRVDARTRLRGFDGRVPELRRGQRVRISMLHCKGRPPVAVALRRLV